MKNLNRLICSIAAGAALVTALPATADSTALRLPCGTWNLSSISFMTVS